MRPDSLPLLGTPGLLFTAVLGLLEWLFQTTVGWINWGWVIGGPLMLLGLIFCIAPILPGNIIILAGCVICGAMNSHDHPVAWWNWAILTAISAGALLLDHVSGMEGARRFGSTKAGIWGALIGGVLFFFLNFFIPIPGVMFLGPFVGTLVGEYLVMRRSIGESLKSGTGSALGVLAGLFIKVGLGLMTIIWFIVAYCWD